MHEVGIYISWGNYSSLSSMHCLHRAYSICEYEYKSIIPDFFLISKHFTKQFSLWLEDVGESIVLLPMKPMDFIDYKETPQG